MGAPRINPDDGLPRMRPLKSPMLPTGTQNSDREWAEATDANVKSRKVGNQRGLAMTSGQNQRQRVLLRFRKANSDHERPHEVGTLENRTQHLRGRHSATRFSSVPLLGAADCCAQTNHNRPVQNRSPMAQTKTSKHYRGSVAA